jgi:V8-like Glu-specific endopeptidase
LHIRLKFFAILITSLSIQAFGNVFIGNNRRPIAIDHAVRKMVGGLFLNGSRICTASLVGPSVLVTAAHCFLDDNNKFIKGEYVFKAGYSSGKSDKDSKLVSSKIKLGTLSRTEDPANDWAVAKLEKPIGLETGWLEVKNVSLQQMTKMRWEWFQNVTYALDHVSGEDPLTEFCRFTATTYRSSLPQNIYLRHNCSLTPGGSGSPMFLIEKLSDGSSVAYLYAVSIRSVTESNGKQIAYSDLVSNSATNVEWFYQAIKDYRASSVGADLIWKFKSE